MFKFGSHSRHRLRTCHTDLQRILKRALGWGIMDFAVMDGHRGEARQEAYFSAGKSKVHWPDGCHNTFPADAVDVAPWIGGAIPRTDTRYWYILAGMIMAAAAAEGVALRGGYDWDGDADLSDQTFNDLGHFERRDA